MNDREFLDLLDQLVSRLDGTQDSRPTIPWYPYDQNLGTRLASRLDESTDIAAVEALLKSEFGAAVSLNFWNPVLWYFSRWHCLQNMDALSHLLSAHDRTRLLALCSTLRGSVLSRLVESIVSAVGTQALEKLATDLDKLCDLHAAPTREAMVSKIELKIGRTLATSERRRLEPVLLELGGMFRRQLS